MSKAVEDFLLKNNRKRNKVDGLTEKLMSKAEAMLKEEGKTFSLTEISKLLNTLMPYYLNSYKSIEDKEECEQKPENDPFSMIAKELTKGGKQCQTKA